MANWRGQHQPADHGDRRAALLLRELPEVLPSQPLDVAGDYSERGTALILLGFQPGYGRGGAHRDLAALGGRVVSEAGLWNRLCGSPCDRFGAGTEIGVERLVERSEILVPGDERGPRGPSQVRRIERIEHHRGPAEGRDSSGSNGESPGAEVAPEPDQPFERSGPRLLSHPIRRLEPGRNAPSRGPRDPSAPRRA